MSFIWLILLAALAGFGGLGAGAGAVSGILDTILNLFKPTTGA